MLGYWLRVSPAELQRAVSDLEWAAALAEQEDVSPPTVRRQRLLDLDKTWDGLDFLLRRRGFPVSVVRGEEVFPFNPGDIPDWGYGPPQYLTPMQVVRAAQALVPLTEQDLVADVDPAELARTGVYPANVGQPRRAALGGLATVEGQGVPLRSRSLWRRGHLLDCLTRRSRGWLAAGGVDAAAPPCTRAHRRYQRHGCRSQVRFFLVQMT
ncbi:uncharacterized protein DUF1877 [Couchioplanes caeruleus]|uniref:Uncharacterized protein DUF1877 n=2 Tax=Couchioplanes caeruleus TaxID=56438 RepID=A0A3N1GBE5_9ACTN|nr:uncharacterized protein DUF1877 [Couchioplanes caeruleus]